MESPHKGLFAVLLLIAAVIVGSLFLYKPQSGAPRSVSGGNTSTPQPTLAPALRLTPAEARGDVAAKKGEILALVSSGKPLTAAQKTEIGGIMLAKAHIYKFSEAEREKIFAALRR